MEKILSWAMLIISIGGFLVSFPLWLTNRMSDRTMIGTTLVLSWAALWFSAITTLFVAK